MLIKSGFHAYVIRISCLSNFHFTGIQFQRAGAQFAIAYFPASCPLPAKPGTAGGPYCIFF